MQPPTSKLLMRPEDVVGGITERVANHFQYSKMHDDVMVSHRNSQVFLSPRGRYHSVPNYNDLLNY